MSNPFTVATQNIPGRAGQTRIRGHLRERMIDPARGKGPKASIWTFQEGMHLVDDFLLIMPNHVKIFSEFGPQPFGVDTREWDVLQQGSFESYPATFVGREGAGPATLSARRVQWLRLQRKDETEALLHVLNIHAPPSKQVPQQPGAEVSRDDLQDKLFEDNARFIDKFVYSSALLMGDFNCTWRHPNMNPFRNIGMHPINDPDVATHGEDPDKPAIDFILGRGATRNGRRRRDLQVVAHGRIPQALERDHYGLWATLEMIR